MDCVLKARRIVLEDGILEEGHIQIQDGRILEVTKEPPQHCITVDFGECLVLPGLIDLHIHGGNGVDVMDGTYTSMNKLSTYLASKGITGFLATTVTSEWDRLIQAIRTVDKARKTGVEGAEILGSYVEGPYISETYRGAHPVPYLRPIDLEELSFIADLFESIKVIAIAPELKNAKEVITAMVDRGIHIALGHSNATFDETTEAINLGAEIAIHTFNGMRPIHHREPGIVGASLINSKIYSEIIVDNIHLHPAIVDLIIKCKGIDKVCLISDCMRAGGLADGSYLLGEENVVVKEAIARTKDGSLAGSTLSLLDAVRNVDEMNLVPLEDIIKMVSLVPATILGIQEQQGSITKGKRANFTVINNQFETVMTMLDGKVIYSKERL